MADSTPRRWLVKWTENVTHLDVAHVSEEEVRVASRLDDESWSQLDEVTKTSMVRYHLARFHHVDDLAGTRRMKVAGRGGFSVSGSAPWPQDAPEPQL